MFINNTATEVGMGFINETATEMVTPPSGKEVKCLAYTDRCVCVCVCVCGGGEG